MNDDTEMQNLLKRSLAEVNPELQKDLWPRMQRRLEEGGRSQNWIAALLSPARLGAVPWFDWASLALLLLGIFLYPNSIPIWLYHF